jgi:hypothetical protein
MKKKSASSQLSILSILLIGMLILILSVLLSTATLRFVGTSFLEILNSSGFKLYVGLIEYSEFIPIPIEIS